MRPAMLVADPRQPAVGAEPDGCGRVGDGKTGHAAAAAGVPHLERPVLAIVVDEYDDQPAFRLG